MPVGGTITLKGRIWQERGCSMINWEIRDGSDVNARIAGGQVNNRQAAHNKIMGHVQLMSGRYGCKVGIDVETAFTPDLSDLEKIKENALEMAGARGAHIEEATETILALVEELQKTQRTLRMYEQRTVNTVARNLFLDRSRHNTEQEWAHLPLQAAQEWFKEARRVLEIREPRVLVTGDTTPVRHLPLSLIRRK